MYDDDYDRCFAKWDWDPEEDFDPFSLYLVEGYNPDRLFLDDPDSPYLEYEVMIIGDCGWTYNELFYDPDEGWTPESEEEFWEKR